MPSETLQANQSNLTHVTTASRVAKCIASRPDMPVVVHWQLPEFPVRLALALLGRRQRLVWVVATTERGDIAEHELSAAGIVVRRIHTESGDADAEPDSLTPLQQVRAKAKRDAALSREQYPQPEAQTVTVISIHRICHRRPLEEIAGWDSALVVFDHIGGLNARWMDIASDKDSQASPSLVGVRTEDGHPIPVLHTKGVPVVFVTRDELEGALIRADFNQRGSDVASFATKYTTSQRLRVTIVATDLVTSKYAAGAFLSISVCNPDVQVVGEALIGAITPQKLSMATTMPLKRAVLKISHQHPDHAEAWRVQTNLPSDVMQMMRIRDFIRTTMLAFDTATRKPELVIFCPWNLAGAVATYSGGTTVRLAAWAPRRPGYEATDQNTFLNIVIDSAASYLGELSHGGRLHRLVETVRTEKLRDIPKKIARLALALHSASALGPTLDLAGRPERFSGLSEIGDKAVGLFNRILDEVYPWSSGHPSNNRDSLDGRQEVIREYSRLMEERRRGS